MRLVHTIRLGILVLAVNLAYRKGISDGQPKAIYPSPTMSVHDNEEIILIADQQQSSAIIKSTNGLYVYQVGVNNSGEISLRPSKQSNQSKQVDSFLEWQRQHTEDWEEYYKRHPEKVTPKIKNGTPGQKPENFDYDDVIIPAGD